ncbi:MAG: glutathione S-transferase N-terminal domain-containing protein [Myxococcaceae bacterium]
MSLLTTSREIAGAITRGLVDPKHRAPRKFAILGGYLASGLRLARGMTVKRSALGPRPEKRLVLWDFERCPHSRTVREALSALDLDVDVKPCPKGGTRFRPQLEGGRGVPQLDDPNTGEHLTGSSRIIEHLYAKYGATKPPVLINATPVRILTGLSARVLTAQRGATARPSKAPTQPLELYSFEASPYCRFVRFVLCELELPYVLYNRGKGSPRRKDFLEQHGKLQFPYLRDPNTGWEGFESQDIEAYLERTWAQ